MMAKTRQQFSKPPETHVVTGGGGYSGLHLGRGLWEKGHRVVLFDINAPTEEIPDGITFIQGDIRNFDDVNSAVDGATCVYHLAAYGMSGRDQLQKKTIEGVNFHGTENVIKACIECAVSRLVYTSTFNVVFGGQTIENGTESLPYWPIERHPDHYSRTKSRAEKVVLAANGRVLLSGSRLRVCALRLAGLYGPGEPRMLPRVMNIIEKGMFLCTYGAANSKVQFLHIDNFVQAHIKAAEALERHQHVAGQTYFISDGKPINNFEFFRPLTEDLGYDFPRIRLPLAIVYFIGFQDGSDPPFQ